jgi:hypothetical protein
VIILILTYKYKTKIKFFEFKNFVTISNWTVDHDRDKKTREFVTVERYSLVSIFFKFKMSPHYVSLQNKIMEVTKENEKTKNTLKTLEEKTTENEHKMKNMEDLYENMRKEVDSKTNPSLNFQRQFQHQQKKGILENQIKNLKVTCFFYKIRWT